MKDERISELIDALKPFALACDEASAVASIPDEKVWLWKPSSNQRETNGISLAHLKAAKAAIKNDAI